MNIKFYNEYQNDIFDENTIKFMLNAALIQSDVYHKSLANFLFQELIEDAHVKYNISQEDMKTMCKRALYSSDS